MLYSWNVHFKQCTVTILTYNYAVHLCWSTLFLCFVDLQNVNITLRVLFRPIVSELPKLYVNLGEDYDDRVLPSITNEVLKAVVVSILNPDDLVLFAEECEMDARTTDWKKNALQNLTNWVHICITVILLLAIKTKMFV